MALSSEAVRQLLIEAFPDATVTVTDLTGTQDHYRVRIVSSVFRGRSRVEQHRLVYRALGGYVGGAVHALALETLAAET